MFGDGEFAVDAVLPWLWTEVMPHNEMEWVVETVEPEVSFDDVTAAAPYGILVD